MCFNVCLIYDLMVMIRFPFSDKQKYMTKYVIFAVSMALCCSFCF